MAIGSRTLNKLRPLAPDSPSQRPTIPGGEVRSGPVRQNAMPRLGKLPRSKRPGRRGRQRSPLAHVVQCEMQDDLCPEREDVHCSIATVRQRVRKNAGRVEITFARAWFQRHRTSAVGDRGGFIGSRVGWGKWSRKKNQGPSDADSCEVGVVAAVSRAWATLEVEVFRACFACAVQFLRVAEQGTHGKMSSLKGLKLLTNRYWNLNCANQAPGALPSRRVTDLHGFILTAQLAFGPILPWYRKRSRQVTISGAIIARHGKRKASSCSNSTL
jgi:hypothetical protein